MPGGLESSSVGCLVSRVRGSGCGAVAIVFAARMGRIMPSVRSVSAISIEGPPPISSSVHVGLLLLGPYTSSFKPTKDTGSWSLGPILYVLAAS